MLLLPLLGACVTAESSFREKALARAAFDLSCPQEQLQIAVLFRNDGLGCAGSQVGVTGCSKKATYVCTASQDWLMNTASNTTSASPDEGPVVGGVR